MCKLFHKQTPLSNKNFVVKFIIFVLPGSLALVQMD